MANSSGKEVRLEREALQRLLAVCRRLGMTANLEEILRVIIDAMRDLLDAERATVFEYDHRRNELFASVAHGLEINQQGTRRDDQAPVTEIRLLIPSGIAGQTAEAKKTIRIADAYTDPRFNPDIDRRTGFATRSILSIPLLSYDDELVGVAQVLNKKTGSFSEEDEAVAEALAAQAAVAIKRARLMEDRLVRLKIERDLELARTIQQQTFPKSIPTIPGYDVAAWNQPADSTGGDAYDVIPLDSSSSSNAMAVSGCTQALFLLADATGHGIGPALHATSMRSMLRMASRLGAEFSSLAHHLNRQIHEDAPDGRFITAWLGLLDTRTHTLRSFSAGQAPLFYFTSRTGNVETRSADDIPFGISDQIESTSNQEIQFEPGDIFAAVSDGVMEARNAARDPFGAPRVAETIARYQELGAAQIIERLRDRLNEFTGRQTPHDDRTALFIRRVT